jgi:multiple sugar transport system substrate-binding protein
MKKVKTNLLLSFLTLMGMCSCTNSSDTKYYSLQIWTYYNGTTETSFQNIVNEFNETKGKELKIAVTTQSKGTTVSDLLSALTNSANNVLGADAMPDLFLAYPDTAFELDKLGKVACLNDYFTSEELSNFNDGYLNEGKIGNNDEFKILPVSKSTEALYINKTDFDKFIQENPSLNIHYEDLSTIEGLIEVSQKYYQTTGKAFFGRDSIDNYFVIGAKQLGIDILRYDENGNYGINYDKTVFKKLWDCYYTPYVKGYFSATGRFRSDDVKVGNVLAYIGSTSSGGYFPSKVITDSEEHDIECKVMVAPTFASGKKYAVSQGAGFCVSKSNQGQEKAACEFLKWLSSKDNITKFCGSSGYFPATKDGFTDEFINSQTNVNFKQSFEVAKETTTNYSMYTNIIGENGNSYRNSLKNSLTNIATEARDAVVKEGMSEESILEYTSETKFEEWFASLSSTK